MSKKGKDMFDLFKEQYKYKIRGLQEAKRIFKLFESGADVTKDVSNYLTTYGATTP